MNARRDERVSGSRLWYRFAYLVQGRDDRDLLPHQTRDAEAALFLHSVLAARGFRYAGPILNYPARHGDAATRVAMDDTFLRPGDLLVLTTRPPLDDLSDGVRNRVRGSDTVLESKVFACLRRHLSHCSRSQVTVSDVHARASAEVARMRNVQFRQKRGAAIDAYLTYASGRWQRSGTDSRTTVAYVIFEERAWATGPGVLACFGMCGTDTLVWNYLLATQYSALVASVPFVMAEITPPERPKRPHGIEFAHEWQLRFLTKHTQGMR